MIIHKYHLPQNFKIEDIRYQSYRPKFQLLDKLSYNNHGQIKRCMNPRPPLWRYQGNQMAWTCGGDALSSNLQISKIYRYFEVNESIQEHVELIR